MGNKTYCRIVVLCVGVLFFAVPGLSAPRQEYQINVIRPKFFVKKSRTEVGADLAAVLNQTFTYTYLLSGAIVYHLTDSLGLGVTGAYGLTVNKEDRDVLKDRFSITVDIFATEWIAESSLLWTPVYGKYQLASGRLVYFDTYVSLGFGMMGISIRKKERGNDDPVDYPYSCYSPVIGAGQRFYLSKKTSLRWQIRDHIILYNGKRCAPAAAEENEPEFSYYHTIVTQVGISYFM